MGAFTRFDPTEWIKKYNIVNYIETGFGNLTSFRHALNFSFEKFYGVDLDRDWYDQAQWLVSDNIILENDYSTEALKKWCNSLSGNTLYYLDSHFPFSDYRGLSYNESISKYKEQSLPLLDELEIIISNNIISQSVFVLDDFFIYAGDDLTEWSRQNPFKYRELAKNFNIDLSPKFIYDQLELTHNIEVDTRDQGYLIVTPK